MMNFENAVRYSNIGSKIVGAVAINVSSLPDYRILAETDAEAVCRVKQTFATALAEFASYRTDGSVSIELVWSTRPTKNQPFLSYIDLTLLFRAVGASVGDCYASLHKISTDFQTVLGGLKVVSSYDTPEKYTSLVSGFSSADILTVKRKDDVIGFSLPTFPFCYKYEAVVPFEVDLDAIVNSLINEENSAVIVQLIPTAFNQAEGQYISMALNSLGRISQGIMVPRMGMYRDQRAEIPMRTYRKYYEFVNSPLLSMNIIVVGNSQGAPNISSKVASVIQDSSVESGAAFEIARPYGVADKLTNVFASPWLIHDSVLAANRNTAITSSQIGGSVYRLPMIFTPAEAAQIFRLPIGTRSVTAGITIHEVEKRNKKFADGIINVADLSIGKLQNVISADEPYVGINLKDLTKHMLVVGTPGSGKSTFLVGLMDRLWKQCGIPFLVIEPAKNEYRSLIDSIPDLQVFSPGKNNVAPYVMNPFVPPKGVTVEKYKSIVKAAFSAAFEMWAPLDQLFDETLNICYSEEGWLDSSTVEDRADCFSLIDFVKTYKEVVSSKGYNAEYKKQIEAAGVLRLNGLLEQNVNIFDSRYSVPVEDILSRPTVIELSSIKDVKQKSFIIALLLNNIYAYVECANANDGKLKNVILLEEAHALLSGDEGMGGSEGASSNAQAVKLLTDMLAEIRSRGVGIVIADQSPKKVTSPVIANTNVKVMFRLVEADDKEIVKKSTVMNELQKERLSKLTCGNALFFFDKLDEVEEITMDDYRLNNGISTDLSDAAIKSRMTYWDSHSSFLKPYADCDHILACEGGCQTQTREYARVVVERVFRKYYIKQFNDYKSFVEFYRGINRIIKEETEAVFGDPNLADKISACVKVQLLRKIHYYTDIDVNYQKRKRTYESMRQTSANN